MLKSLLLRLGLLAAPAPFRKYAAASSVFGVMPVALFFAWKHRGEIVSQVRRLRSAQAAPATA